LRVVGCGGGGGGGGGRDKVKGDGYFSAIHWSLEAVAAANQFLTSGVGRGGREGGEGGGGGGGEGGGAQEEEEEEEEEEEKATADEALSTFPEREVVPLLQLQILILFLCGDSCTHSTGSDFSIHRQAEAAEQ
jgi:hypothetical protein